jgi:Flp pilus assembly pilin Flp
VSNVNCVPIAPKEMTIRSLRLREFVNDDSGAEIIEFAIILASFTIIALSAVSFMGTTANTNIGQDTYSLSNGALNPP